MSVNLIERLEEADLMQEEAASKDLIELRTWICQDMFLDYESFKKQYIVATKTPGMDAYKEAASQLCNKYEFAIPKTTYEGNLQYISTCMENKGRRLPAVQQTNPPVAKSVRGNPIVQKEAYHPDLQERQRESQVHHKEHLIAMSMQSKQDVQKISMLMHQSYELQRDDICNALEAMQKDSRKIFFLTQYGYNYSKICSQF